MPTPDQWKLIQRAVDGELSAEDELAFQKLLATDAEFEREYLALRETVVLLEEAPRLAPPAGFAQRVEAAVAAQGTVVRLPATNGRPQRKHWPVAAAAVVLLGLGLLFVDSRLGDDPALNGNGMVGTLAPRSFTPPPLESLALEDLVSLKPTFGSSGPLILHIEVNEEFELALEDPLDSLSIATTGPLQLVETESGFVISGRGPASLSVSRQVEERVEIGRAHV